MSELNELFARLETSRFRQRVRLRGKELAYLQTKGLDEVLAHAARFIAERLAPAAPASDGRQTPWNNHPVFVAQHATATCCRRCLAKWHAIETGRPLTDEEQRYIISVLRRWLSGDRAPAVQSPQSSDAGEQQATLW